MKLDHSRLSKMLHILRFEVGLDTWAHDWNFTRADASQPLYHHIQISFSGQKREAVVARVYVCCGKHVNTRGMCKDKLLLEVASNVERGWSIISSREEARKWEERVCQVAPKHVEALTDEMGPALQRTCAGALAATLHYQSRLPDCESAYQLVNTLSKGLSSDSRAIAARLAESAGVMQLQNTEEMYHAACLALLAFHEEIEPIALQVPSLKTDAPPWNVTQEHHPLRNPELMWRIQLIADGLIEKFKTR